MGCARSRPRAHKAVRSYLRDEARTGDLLLFRSNSRFACMIACVTCSTVSHVGMVVRTTRPIVPGSKNTVYIWHSPSERLTDPTVLGLLETDRRGRLETKDGPQLNNLSQFMRHVTNDTIVELRELNLPDEHPWMRRSDGTIDPDDLSEDTLIAHMKKYGKRIYQRGTRELILAVYDGPGGDNTEDTTELFCSELIALTYSRFGIINTRLPSNEFVPGDFVAGQVIDQALVHGTELTQSFDLY